VQAGTLDFRQGTWWYAKDYVEPERKFADGTVRKAHYGDGVQPWDTMRSRGWACIFATGSVLKYVRRAAAKNGEDDIKKAWYFQQLKEMMLGSAAPPRTDILKIEAMTPKFEMVLARAAFRELVEELSMEELKQVES
jgi:hypothetical protein